MVDQQQPEQARSPETDLDPDSVETGVGGQRQPAEGGAARSVPEGSAPGHHPDHEQDKPMDAFVAKAKQLAAEAATQAEEPQPEGDEVDGGGSDGDGDMVEPEPEPEADADEDLLAKVVDVASTPLRLVGEVAAKVLDEVQKATHRGAERPPQAGAGPP